MGRVAFTAIVVALSALLVAAPASATSCVQPEFQSSLDRAGLVFVGVASVQSESGMQTVARFNVTRVFKGTVPKSVRVRGGGMTGATFVSGTRYLVFADIKPDGEVSAHLCGGTGPVDPAWLKLLGAGNAPAKSGPALAAAPVSDAGTPSSDGASDASDASDANAAPPESTEPEPSAPGTSAPPPTPQGSDSSPGPAVPPKSGCGACSSAGSPGNVSGLWAVGALLAGRLRRRHSQPRQTSRTSV